MELPAVLQSFRWVSDVRSVSIAFVLVTAIALSEAFIYFGQVQTALVGHLAVLIVCIVAPLFHETGLSLYQGVLFVPVFRLATVGIPIYTIPAFRKLFGESMVLAEPSTGWLVFVYGPFVPVLLYAVRYNPSVELDPGWRITVVLFPALLVLGTALATVGYAIHRPEGLLQRIAYVDLAVVTIVMVGIVALVEEVLFRGLLQESLQDHLGTLPGIVVSSAVFAMTYSVYQIPALIGFGFGFGVVLGVLYYKTRSVAAIVLTHGSVQTLLYGVFPVTGAWVPVA